MGGLGICSDNRKDRKEEDEYFHEMLHPISRSGYVLLVLRLCTKHNRGDPKTTSFPSLFIIEGCVPSYGLMIYDSLSFWLMCWHLNGICFAKSAEVLTRCSVFEDGMLGSGSIKFCGRHYFCIASLRSILTSVSGTIIPGIITMRRKITHYFSEGAINALPCPFWHRFRLLQNKRC